MSESVDSGRYVVVLIEHGFSGRDPDLGMEGLRAAVGLLRATEPGALPLVDRVCGSISATRIR